jgi:hypothetical protein
MILATTVNAHSSGVWGFITYWLGLTDPASAPYLFWSGFGGCIRDIIVIWILVLYYKSRSEHWWDDPRV